MKAIKLKKKMDQKSVVVSLCEYWENIAIQDLLSQAWRSTKLHRFKTAHAF